MLDGGLKFYLGTRIAALTVTYLALKEQVIAEPPRPVMEQRYNLVRETWSERGVHEHSPQLQAPQVGPVQQSGGYADVVTMPGRVGKVGEIRSF